MLYVPLDFENGLTIDALVDSGAYVSAIDQKELDKIKQHAPSNILKNLNSSSRWPVRKTDSNSHT